MAALASSGSRERPVPFGEGGRGAGGCAKGGHGAGRRALASLLLSPRYSTPTEKLINLRCCFAALGQFLLYLNESVQHLHTA